MTEKKWLDDPYVQPKLQWLVKQKASQRKLRLFAVACCKKASIIPSDTNFDWELDIAEAYADPEEYALKLNEWTELQSDHSKSDVDPDPFHFAQEYMQIRLDSFEGAVRNLAYGVCNCLEVDMWISVEPAAESAVYAIISHSNERSELARALHALSDSMVRLHQAGQTDILHDIFGNPFRPVTLERSWLTSTVLALANGIYSERAHDRMPILADALQDAGCDNDGILNHCRQVGEHTRGCWVVDLLLDRK